MATKTDPANADPGPSATAPVVVAVARMDDREARMRCVEAALQLRTPGMNRGQILEIAREFEGYVLVGGPPPA